MILFYLSQSACDIYAYIGLLELTNAGAGAFSAVQQYKPIFQSLKYWTKTSLTVSG